jgi:hypothetical protein
MTLNDYYEYHYAKCIYAECCSQVHYAECRHAECRCVQLLTDVTSGPGHSDGTLGGRDAVNVAHRPDAHGRGDGLTSMLQNFVFLRH